MFCYIFRGVDNMAITKIKKIEFAYTIILTSSNSHFDTMVLIVAGQSPKVIKNVSIKYVITAICHQASYFW